MLGEEAARAVSLIDNQRKKEGKGWILLVWADFLFYPHSATSTYKTNLPDFDLPTRASR